eukprot:7237192-Alexandrium_andersonii.AAC.1
MAGRVDPAVPERAVDHPPLSLRSSAPAWPRPSADGLPPRARPLVWRSAEARPRARSARRPLKRNRGHGPEQPTHRRVRRHRVHSTAAPSWA